MNVGKVYMYNPCDEWNKQYNYKYDNLHTNR